MTAVSIGVYELDSVTKDQDTYKSVWSLLVDETCKCIMQEITMNIINML